MQIWHASIIYYCNGSYVMKYLIASVITAFGISLAHAGEVSTNLKTEPHFGFLAQKTSKIFKAANISSEKQAIQKHCNVSFSLPNADTPKKVGVLKTMNWSFYSKADSGIKVSNMEDLKKYTIGSHEEGLISAFLNQKKFNVSLSAEEAQSLDKLSSGKVDLWAVYNGIAEQNAEHRNDTKINPVFKVSTQIVLSCDKSLGEQTTAKLQKAFSSQIN